jgi:hypothetical protein
MGDEVLQVDARLPDDSDQEEAELFALAEKLHPGDLRALFWVNRIWREAADDRAHRLDDDWRA